VKTDRILIPAAALSLAGAAVAYFFLPGTVPIHWNAAGEIDGYGGKGSVLLLGALPLALALGLRYLPLVDPRRENHRRHERAYDAMKRLLVPAFIALDWTMILVALGAPLDSATIGRAIIGLLFLGLGNFMGQLKRNYFIGIKTPWALADDEVWRLTHRRGAYVFVLMGAAYILSLAIPGGPLLAAFILAATLGGVAYIFLYSYLAWRRLRGPDSTAGLRRDEGDRP